MTTIHVEQVFTIIEAGEQGPPGPAGPPGAGSGGGSGSSAVLDLANDPATTSGLVYGYQAGTAYFNAGEDQFLVQSGLVVLPPSSVVFVELRLDPESPINLSLTGFGGGNFPMAIVTTGADSIVSIEDQRDFRILDRRDFARRNEANTFTGSQFVSLATVEVNENPPAFLLETGIGNVQVFNLRASAVLRTNSAIPGAVITLICAQDAIGGHTLGFSDSFVFPSGEAPVLSVAPYAIDVLRLTFARGLADAPDPTQPVILCEIVNNFLSAGAPPPPPPPPPPTGGVRLLVDGATDIVDAQGHTSEVFGSLVNDGEAIVLDSFSRVEFVGQPGEFGATGAFCWEAFVKPDVANTFFQIFMASASDGSSTDGAFFEYSTSRGLRWSTNSSFISLPGAPVDGVERHLFACRDASGLTTLGLGGVIVAQQSLGLFPVLNGTGRFSIGQLVSVNDPSFAFIGTIRGVRITVGSERYGGAIGDTYAVPTLPLIRE